MTDTAAEPLIPNHGDLSDDAREQHEDAVVEEIDESALVSPGLFIWGLTICAGVSGLLFGYEYVLKQHAAAVPYATNSTYQHRRNIFNAYIHRFRSIVPASHHVR